VLVLFSWVLFRAPTLAHAVAYLGRMVNVFAAAPAAAAGIEFGLRHQALLVAALVLCFGPAVRAKSFDFMRLVPEEAIVPQAAARFAVALLLLVWSAAVLATSQFNPFIYFRF
jgi:alginate O-acetyltransferase complex protein AlgI